MQADRRSIGQSETLAAIVIFLASSLVSRFYTGDSRRLKTKTLKTSGMPGDPWNFYNDLRLVCDDLQGFCDDLKIICDDLCAEPHPESVFENKPLHPLHRYSFLSFWAKSFVLNCLKVQREFDFVAACSALRSNLAPVIVDRWMFVIRLSKSADSGPAGAASVTL